jgi:hypothetical protein
MLGDGADITVPPEDPQAFAEMLRTLLGEGERLAAAGKAARERGAGLRWNAFAQRFAAIARACAAQRRRPVPSGIVRPRGRLMDNAFFTMRGTRPCRPKTTPTGISSDGTRPIRF